MHLLRAQHQPVCALQCACCVGAGYHGGRITQVETAMRGRVDAHVRHETGQHDFWYAERFELRVEIDLNKRIGLVFGDHRLARYRCYLRRNCADIRVYVVGRARTGIVLNVKYRHFQITRHG